MERFADNVTKPAKTASKSADGYMLSHPDSCSKDTCEITVSSSADGNAINVILTFNKELIEKRLKERGEKGAIDVWAAVSISEDNRLEDDLTLLCTDKAEGYFGYFFVRTFIVISVQGTVTKDKITKCQWRLESTVTIPRIESKDIKLNFTENLYHLFLTDGKYTKS